MHSALFETYVIYPIDEVFGEEAITDHWINRYLYDFQSII